MVLNLRLTNHVLTRRVGLRHINHVLIRHVARIIRHIMVRILHVVYLIIILAVPLDADVNFTVIRRGRVVPLLLLGILALVINRVLTLRVVLGHIKRVRM